MPALLAGLCVLCALPPAAWAGRPVRVYEVDVDGQSAPAVQNAMRQALVRATGRRESADDPAFASLVADAPKYVKSYAAGPRGESQVVFDAAAVEQAVGAVGRSVWDRVRPFTLVVLAPPRNRAAQDAARAELERAAAERGLPISLVPVTVDDAAGSALGTDALMQTAQRRTAVTRSWWAAARMPARHRCCSGLCTRARRARAGAARWPPVSSTRSTSWCRRRAVPLPRLNRTPECA